MIATTPFGASAQIADTAISHAAPPEFSLVAGGPFFRLLCRVHLADESLGHLARRVVVITLITWMPLLVLATLEGDAWHGVRVPFLLDASLHLRLLLAVPLLLAAEPVVHDWMHALTTRFVERGIVDTSTRAQLEAAVRAAHRLRDSVYPEAIIVIAVLAIGAPYNWHRIAVLHDSTWYWTMQGGAGRGTVAGWWAGLISLPLFQFVLLRWYVRLFIWAQFLWRVSRLPLRLAPTQPDRAGGLGFIGTATEGFWVLLMAHGALGAAVMAHGMLFGGVTLLQYRLEIVALCALTLLWVVAPLLTFAPMLVQTRRAGGAAYGELSQRYAFDFEQKWMTGVPTEDSLGSADIQSLADLRNGYEVVSSMRLIPIGRGTIFRLMLCPLLPIAPLALATVPIDRLLGRVLAALF